MKRVFLACLFLAACAPAPVPDTPAPAAQPPLTAPQQIAWVQLGESGAVEVRVVTPDNATPCPVLTADHAQDIAMTQRAPATDGFARICSAVLPPGSRAASLNWTTSCRPDPPRLCETLAVSQTLHLPRPDPQRILVLGDTGCRLKDQAVQACNDPKAWPFPQVAAAAAKLKPDLVIDVGDYQYRETPCPPRNAGCAGSPYGDNWPTWWADFFQPARPLLEGAPWIFVRGNHEDCMRAGPGWLRLLGPLPFGGPCAAHLSPYRVPLGGFDAVVMDDANASDTDVDAAQTPVYAAELAGLKTGARPTWLLLHRPIWAAISGPLGVPVGGNAQLIAAAGKTLIPPPVALMLSGHIHSFEALNYDSGVPPQIVAGHGGDNLDVTPASLKGAIFQGHSGVSVRDGLSVGGFGFLMLTRSGSGWDVELYDSNGAPERRCRFAPNPGGVGRLDCPSR